MMTRSSMRCTQKENSQCSNGTDALQRSTNGKAQSAQSAKHNAQSMGLMLRKPHVCSVTSNNDSKYFCLLLSLPNNALEFKQLTPVSWLRVEIFYCHEDQGKLAIDRLGEDILLPFPFPHSPSHSQRRSSLLRRIDLHRLARSQDAQIHSTASWLPRHPGDLSLQFSLCEGPPAKLQAHPAQGLFSFGSIWEGDEAETTGLAAVSIFDELYFDLSNSSKSFSDVILHRSFWAVNDWILSWPPIDHTHCASVASGDNLGWEARWGKKTT